MHNTHARAHARTHTHRVACTQTHACIHTVFTSPNAKQTHHHT